MTDQLLEMARDMGEAIQMDDRFVELQMAQAKADEDEELQALVGEFNVKRIALTTESTKDDRDEAKVKRLDDELRAAYDRVMANESMQAFSAARAAMDSLLSDISRILRLSAQGEDPRKIEGAATCGGNCGSCGGCH
ncbi:MAG: YlbF family regulator [Clostridia bacterium]|nr:YlbF family regulator [Clostridia bacterium]